MLRQLGKGRFERAFCSGIGLIVRECVCVCVCVPSGVALKPCVYVCTCWPIRNSALKDVIIVILQIDFSLIAVLFQCQAKNWWYVNVYLLYILHIYSLSFEKKIYTTYSQQTYIPWIRIQKQINKFAQTWTKFLPRTRIHTHQLSR